MSEIAYSSTLKLDKLKQIGIDAIYNELVEGFLSFNKQVNSPGPVNPKGIERNRADIAMAQNGEFIVVWREWKVVHSIYRGFFQIHARRLFLRNYSRPPAGPDRKRPHKTIQK